MLFLVEQYQEVRQLALPVPLVTLLLEPKVVVEAIAASREVMQGMVVLAVVVKQTAPVAQEEQAIFLVNVVVMVLAETVAQEAVEVWKMLVGSHPALMLVVMEELGKET